jgi:lactoylglutathione lyase
MDESIRFYEQFLGFKMTTRFISNGKELAFLSHEGMPEFEIELIRDLQPTISYSGDGLVNHIAFIVDDMEETMSYYRQHGIVFETEEPKRGMNGRRTIRFRGPNNEALQLVEERTEQRE